MKPTVMIKVAPCPGNEQGTLIINEEDFDPAKHTLVGAPESAAPSPASTPSETQPNTDGESGEVDWGQFTNAELRQFLDSKGVRYHKDDNKAELIRKCEALA